MYYTKKCNGGSLCCLEFKWLVFLFQLQEFKMPHDIAETRDGSVFVGDASSKSVYKFTAESKFIFIKIILPTFNCSSKIYHTVCLGIKSNFDWLIYFRLIRLELWLLLCWLCRWTVVLGCIHQWFFCFNYYLLFSRVASFCQESWNWSSRTWRSVIGYLEAAGT